MTSEVKLIPPRGKYSSEEKVKLQKEAQEILSNWKFPEPTEDGPRRFTHPKGFQIRYRKCGKSNCRCARGEPHGPYLYKVTWDKLAKKQLWQYIGRFKL